MKSTSGHTDRMGLAGEYRLLALQTAKEGLNHAQRLLRNVALDEESDPFAHQAPDHKGDHARRLDARMNEFIRGRIFSAAPNVTYWSEEEDKTIFPEPGDVLVWADPLDGTTNALTTFGAYAVVILVDQCERRGERVVADHLAGAIATHKGEVVSWTHYQQFGQVWIDWPLEYCWPGTEASSPSGGVHDDYAVQIGHRHAGVAPRAGASVRLAAVASGPENRTRLLELFELQKYATLETEARPWLSTLAGNPSVVDILLGELGALIELDSVTVHDGAWAIPAVLAGGQVADVDDQDVFLWEALEQTDPRRRRLTPFVAAMDGGVLKEVRSRWRDAR